MTKIIAILWIVCTITFSPVSLSDPKAEYESKCTACHGFGIAGAPKFGDQEDWAGRLEKGIEQLYDNAINGFTGEHGTMPPKGGFDTLRNAQVKAIVDYMVSGLQ